MFLECRSLCDASSSFIKSDFFLFYIPVHVLTAARFLYKYNINDCSTVLMYREHRASDNHSAHISEKKLELIKHQIGHQGAKQMCQSTKNTTVPQTMNGNFSKNSFTKGYQMKIVRFFEVEFCWKQQNSLCLTNCRSLFE